MILTIGGSSHTLAELGLSSAVLTLSNRGADTLVLTQPGPIDAPALIAPFQRVILADDNGVGRFVGWLDTAPKAAEGRSESRSYTLTGPQRWLAQTYLIADGIGGIRLLTPDFSDPTKIGALDTGLRDLLDRVIAQHPGSIAYDNASLNASIFQHQGSAEIRIDTTCADALDRILGYAPTSACYWDYTAAPTPTLRFLDSAQVTPNHILTEANRIVAGSLDPQYGALRKSVTIFWTSDAALLRTDTITDPASDASVLGATRPLVLTLQLGAYLTPAGTGLAEALHAWHSRLHVNCRVAFPVTNWARRPADLWAFGGIFAGSRWTAFCHQIQRDLLTGAETLSLGIPPAFGIVPLSGPPSSQPSPSPTEETGTLSVTIFAAGGGLDTDLAHWTAGPVSGNGSSSVSLPPGNYTILFHPAWDETSAKYFLAPPQQVTITKNQTTAATGAYVPLDRMVLGSTETIDLNSEDIDEDTGPAKLREYYVVINGALRKAKFLTTLPYDP